MAVEYFVTKMKYNCKTTLTQDGYNTDMTPF